MTDASNPDVDRHVAVLQGDDPVERQSAREELIKIGRPATGALVPLLKHQQQHVRWESAKTLGGIADPSTALPLVETLKDEDQDVRWVAGEALVELGDAGLKALLTALTDANHVEHYLRGARHAAHKFAEKRPGPELQKLADSFDTADPALSVPVAAQAVVASMTR